MLKLGNIKVMKHNLCTKVIKYKGKNYLITYAKNIET